MEREATKHGERESKTQLDDNAAIWRETRESQGRKAGYNHTEWKANDNAVRGKGEDTE